MFFRGYYGLLSGTVITPTSVCTHYSLHINTATDIRLIHTHLIYVEFYVTWFHVRGNQDWSRFVVYVAGEALI
jgi:hypothetical protein